MLSAINRLRLLKVRDIMSHQVINVSANQTMAEAAQAFADNDVSSAPVTDEQGRCVGVLSAADFIKRDSGQDDEFNGRELTQREQAAHAPDDCLTLKRTSDTVREYMSSAVQTVKAEATLLDAARAMCAEHVHRLPVLQAQRPVGVISTMDIVAALINAVDEEMSQFKPLDF